MFKHKQLKEATPLLNFEDNNLYDLSTIDEFTEDSPITPREEKQKEKEKTRKKESLLATHRNSSVPSLLGEHNNNNMLSPTHNNSPRSPRSPKSPRTRKDKHSSPKKPRTLGASCNGLTNGLREQKKKGKNSTRNNCFNY